ncbi:TPA: hypothetical protein RD400_004072 [Escherichia coli]|nr:hypothetical protein [Escherichia coli]HDT7450699.1 hypothetical protein [Escherichia coli]HDT7465330.1 hypothetical protein [Escherichia coli]HDW8735566.1 hypothetical protein [Escherichia coli]
MIWQPEFTDKTLSRKPGAVQDILITWLQDNIDCESGIIFDNDEDKTGSAALLRCIEQAREGIRTLRQQ